MLLVICDAHKLFESPPSPPVIRILKSPPSEQPIPSAIGTDCATSSDKRTSKSGAGAREERVPRPVEVSFSTEAPSWAAAVSKQLSVAASIPTRDPQSRISRRSEECVMMDVADVAQVIDCLVHPSTTNQVLCARVRHTRIPPHVVQFLNGGVGLGVIASHWKHNRKRICELMAKQCATMASESSDASLPILASDAVLRLAAEVAAGQLVSVPQSDRTTADTLNLLL